MPHKCVKCAKYFADGSPELMKGCPCGGRVFLFIRPEQMSLKELYDAGVEIAVQNDRIQELAKSQPVSIELDLEGAGSFEPSSQETKIVGGQPAGELPSAAAMRSAATKKPASGAASHVISVSKAGVVGVRVPPKARPKEADAAENVTIVEKGVYELDLDGLMNGDPLVVRSQNGVYYVKIPAVKKKKEAAGKQRS